VVIVDKSSSMEGRKIELAPCRCIRRGGESESRTIISVVLMFDNSFQWAVPIRLANDIPDHPAPRLPESFPMAVPRLHPRAG